MISLGFVSGSDKCALLRWLRFATGNIQALMGAVKADGALTCIDGILRRGVLVILLAGPIFCAIRKERANLHQSRIKTKSSGGARVSDTIRQYSSLSSILGCVGVCVFGGSSDGHQTLLPTQTRIISANS